MTEQLGGKRPYCPRCELPEVSCICALLADIPPLALVRPVHIIQHPMEVKHSKNSVRLLKLLLPEIQLWCGESAEDLAPLQAAIAASGQPVACFFPGEGSVAFEQSEAKKPQFSYVFIDATWRKARKIWHLNPWLQALPRVHFQKVPQQQYHIRKAQLNHQLSTLEAVACGLAADMDTQPLLKAFAAFQQRYQARVEQGAETLPQA